MEVKQLPRSGYYRQFWKSVGRENFFRWFPCVVHAFAMETSESGPNPVAIIEDDRGVVRTWHADGYVTFGDPPTEKQPPTTAEGA